MKAKACKKPNCGRKLDSSQVYRHIALLELINKVKDRNLKNKLFDLAGSIVTDTASSICRNILTGSLRVKDSKIRKLFCEKRRVDTEALADIKTPFHRKKQLLLGEQKGSGGLAPFLPLIIKTLPSLISTIAGLALRRRRR